MEKIKIEISRVLYESGYKPYTVRCLTHRVKGADRRFSNLKDLKDYYQIRKVNKTERTGWAISPKGKKHEWPIYEAEISNIFIQ